MHPRGSVLSTTTEMTLYHLTTTIRETMKTVLVTYSKGTSDETRKHFDKSIIRSPIPRAVAKLNKLTGVTFHLSIYWRDIRKETPVKVLDNESLIDLVCSSTYSFLEELCRLIKVDEEFSGEFCRKFGPAGRLISVQTHPLASKPFSRVVERATSPALELHLPRIKKGDPTKGIPLLCGLDLSAALSGQSGLEPIVKQEDRCYIS